jgi:hypothetical protein
MTWQHMGAGQCHAHGSVHPSQPHVVGWSDPELAHLRYWAHPGEHRRAGCTDGTVLGARIVMRLDQAMLHKLDEAAQEREVATMARVRSLEGREAGILAGIIQGVFRLALGRPLNPTKVQAHAPRAMLASFLSNLLFGSGRWAVGRDLVQMVRIRVAARNGCPF